MEDLLIESLQELIEAVKFASPELWRIAMQQVQVKIWRTILAIVVALLGVIGFSWASVKVWKMFGDDITAAPVLVFSWVFLIVSFVVVIRLLTDLIQYTLNPEYTAIQVLLELVQ